MIFDHCSHIVFKALNPTKKGDGDTYNGFVILQFSFQHDFRYMDGLMTGKCIEMVDDNIVEIKGTFVDDNLQVI